MRTVTTAWPAVGWERVPWTPSRDADVSRTQRRRHLGPFDAAVVPPIADLDVPLSRETLAVALEAASSVTRFDEHSTARLGGTEIGPVDAVLLRTESASSSQIENLTVGARQLAMAALGGSSGRDAALVVRNVTTMRAALALADRLDVEALLELHAALLHGIDPDAGSLREEQMWIGGSGVCPHHAQFVPPTHGPVHEALGDLARFMSRDDLPPMVQAAVAHAQFETIHPFTDGNGRTGRALVHALLRHQRVTERVTVPVSAGLLSDVEGYVAALDAYRDGDPEPIVLELCEATFLAIGNGSQLLERLEAVRGEWDRRLTARRDAAAWKVADLLLAQPVVSTGHVADRLGVSGRTAQTAIDRLAAAGVLTLVRKQARNRVWQAPEVVDALDAFAHRAGRRRRSG
ncbi:MAG: Fic family protein [Nocardioidaceae bacterium]|nr:Fic family protein [Nocardioidaceae bacterium]